MHPRSGIYLLRLRLRSDHHFVALAKRREKKGVQKNSGGKLVVWTIRDVDLNFQMEHQKQILILF